MTRNLSRPLNDGELQRLDEFLLNRLDDEVSDRIAAEGGDEGILSLSECDGFMTAIVSGPNVIAPSRWLPAMWGAEEPIWESMDQLQEIVGLMIRHQNDVAATLMSHSHAFEPMFNVSQVGGDAQLVVDEWCCGYMRAVGLDEWAWRAGAGDVEKLLRPIELWGTEEGWRKLRAMTDAEQDRERNAIAESARALHKYWLDRRSVPQTPVRRAAPRAGRNAPCPCGSGKKYKHCCMH